MTLTVTLLTPTIDAAPGDVATAPLRLTNDGTEPLDLTIRVIGLVGEPNDPEFAPTAATVPAGSSISVGVPIAVPSSLGVGQHAAAFEVAGSAGASLTPFTLSIMSLERVHMVPIPGTIRGRRRTKFVLDMTSQEPSAVGFFLEAEAPDVRVRFAPDYFMLVPGEQAISRAKVRGPRQLTGSPTQHNLVITARGRASSTSITMPYVQRPVIGSKLRSVVAAFAVIALVVAAVVGVIEWRERRAEDAGASTTVSDERGGLGPLGPDATGGDGTGDGTGGDGTGGGGTGGDGTGGDGTGGGGTGGDGTGGDGTGGDGTGGEGTGGDGTGGDGTGGGDTTGEGGDGTGGDGTGADTTGGDAGDALGAARRSPVSTSVTGTVTVDVDDGTSVEDSLDGVVIKLRELELGEEPPEDAIVGFRRPQSSGPTKIWSARRSSAPSELGRIRQTAPVAREGQPNAQGIWLFSDVRLQRTYELVFQKEGFQTQSYVIEPPDDGSLVEVAVRLQPGDGSIDGRVIGPPSGLRNAAISITDGTITSATTAASDTGGFTIDGLSTPAVYTLTAMLPGYGTVVRQVTLDADEDLTGLDVALVPGEATVSGTVFGPDSQGLGDVDITLTVGDLTLTTTTRTQGAVGSYSIPGIDVDPQNPQRVVVTASHDGFVEASTQRRVSGNVSDVNFRLDRDTIQLTGTVRSDVVGTPPIEGAQVEVTTSDHTFIAQTDAAGTFTVDDLPPHDYVVAFSHFLHEPAWEALRLDIGQVPAPLAVTLVSVDPDAARAQLRANLTIRVIDPEGTTQAEREVENAEAVLTDVATGTVLPILPKNPASNEITYDVPIGTYGVVVRHDDYNVAPRREVTVGLSGDTIEVALDKKLTAGGRVVDSVSLLPLDDYTVEVHREVTGPDEPIDVVELVGGEWETAEPLEIGTYRVTVTESPGYRVRADQVLDGSLTGSNRFMRFEIRTELTRKFEVNDIKADPYAEVTGRVFKPAVDAVGAVQFVPIDEPQLSVEMECQGRSAIPNLTAPATLTDELTVVDPAGTLIDTYTFAREVFALQQGSSGTTCVIDASAGADYIPLDPIKLSNVRVSNGATLTDRVVNVALAQTVDSSFTGTVFWVDPKDGATYQLPRARLISTGAGAITGFTPSIGGPLQNELEPKPVFSELSTVTDDNGAWTLEGQLVGETIYRFEDPSNRFTDATIRVLIDATGKRTVTAIDGATVVSTNPDGPYDIRLDDLTPGTVRGTVEVLTRDTSSPVVTVNATSPTGVSVDRFPAGNSEFTIANATPGTWEVAFGAPDNHEFVPGFEGPVSRLVEPNETDEGFDTKLFELGRIDLTWTAKSTQTPKPPLPEPTVTVIDVDTDAMPPLTATPDPSASSRFTVSGIPVQVDATTNPATFTTTNYLVTFDAAGFDSSAADIELSSGPACIRDASELERSSDATDIPMRFDAGEKCAVEIMIPPHGTITGVIEGQRASGSVDGLDVSPDGAAEVVVEEVDPITGVGVPRPDIVATKPVGSAAGTFVISAEPGRYRLTVSHPEFAPDPLVEPAGSATGVAGEFTMVNDTPNVVAPPWLLLERSTNLFLDVFTTLDKDVRREAVYTLTPDDTSTYAILTGDVPAAGVPIEGLAPLQRYTLRVESKPETAPSFPAVTTIVPPRSTANDVRFVQVTAVLPAVEQTVVATVDAENSRGEPVVLPAGISVSSDFDSSGLGVVVIDNDGTATKPNLADTSFDGTAGSGSSSSVDYSFPPLPTGVHTVTVSTPTSPVAGYRLLSPTSIDVTMPGPGDPTFTYIAENVLVLAQLPPGDYPGLTWELESPSNVTISSSDWVTECESVSPHPAPCTFGYQLGDDNVLRIEGVPPEIGDFTLTLDSDLHAETETTVQIPVQADGQVEFDALITAESARLSVTLRTDDGSGTLGDLPKQDTTVTITPAVPGAPTTSETGLYEFELAVTAGTYTMLVQHPDYAPNSLPNLSLANGFVTTGTLTLGEKATIDVTLVRTPTSTAAVPDPSGLQIALYDDRGVRYSTSTKVGDAHRFRVPGGVAYQIEVNADIYPNAFIVGGPGTFFPAAIGQSVPRNAPIPRVVTVDVTSPPTGVTVAATIGSNPTRTDTTAPFRFDYTVDEASALGSGVAKITATGYRTRTATIPDELITQIPSTDADLLPTVTAFGTVPVPVNTPFTVTSPAVPPATGTTTLDGVTTLNGSGVVEYRMPGLDVGPDGEARTWTVHFDVPGYGVADVGLPQVTGTSSSTIEQDIPECGGGVTTDCLQPQTIPVTFSVWDGTTALAGATVTVLNGTSTVASGTTVVNTTTNRGEVTLNVPEHLSGLTYTVELATYITPAAKPLTGFPITGPLPRPTSIDGGTTVLYQLRGTGSGADANKNNVKLDLCADASCSPKITTETVSSDAAGNFSFFFDDPPDAGASYIIDGQQGGNTGTVSVTIADDGSYATPLTITLMP